MAHLPLHDVGADRDVALATGEGGTVYLCHPFLIHAAQKHRGKNPRFMSQPPLLPAVPLSLERADGQYSPVEIAIREALKDIVENPVGAAFEHQIADKANVIKIYFSKICVCAKFF